MIADGTWSAEKIVGELGDVILGNVPARLKESDTVVFESVGMPIWDTVTTAWAYRWAAANGVGVKFSLE
jgi:ornithine cyclodeaminase